MYRCGELPSAPARSAPPSRPSGYHYCRGPSHSGIPPSPRQAAPRDTTTVEEPRPEGCRHRRGKPPRGIPPLSRNLARRDAAIAAEAPRDTTIVEDLRPEAYRHRSGKPPRGIPPMSRNLARRDTAIAAASRPEAADRQRTQRLQRFRQGRQGAARLSAAVAPRRRWERRLLRSATSVAERMYRCGELPSAPARSAPPSRPSGYHYCRGPSPRGIPPSPRQAAPRDTATVEEPRPEGYRHRSGKPPRGIPPLSRNLAPRHTAIAAATRPEAYRHLRGNPPRGLPPSPRQSTPRPTATVEELRPEAYRHRRGKPPRGGRPAANSAAAEIPPRAPRGRAAFGGSGASSAMGATSSQERHVSRRTNVPLW